MPQSGKQFQGRYDGSQIFLASSSSGGGHRKLLREAFQRQCHPEAEPLLQHELEIFQEQIDFHLSVEAVAHHEWAPNIDHLRGGRAFFEAVK